MKLKKIPSNKDIVTIFISGLFFTSFGVWFIWLPFLGYPLLFIGSVMALTAIITTILKVLQ